MAENSFNLIKLHPPEILKLIRRLRVQTLELNNGVHIPSLGLGVFRTPSDITAKAVQEALHIGYRHIDTAAAYGNEREVGAGIHISGIPRTEIFIETKIWISDYGYDATMHAFEKSARKLGVNYIDLLLLHQPLTNRFDLTLDSYRALERLLSDGKVRAIGVSNFMPDVLAKLLAETSVVPAVNQIEVHPYFQQKALQSFNALHGILTQAWSPIAGITSFTANEKSIFEDSTLLMIGQKYNKTPAQVMLRWHLQEGRSAIPKSTQTTRISENYDVFNFDLTREELAAIDALDTGVRSGPNPDSITLDKYGFEIPEA